MLFPNQRLHIYIDVLTTFWMLDSVDFINLLGCHSNKLRLSIQIVCFTHKKWMNGPNQQNPSENFQKKVIKLISKRFSVARVLFVLVEFTSQLCGESLKAWHQFSQCRLLCKWANLFAWFSCSWCTLISGYKCLTVGLPNLQKFTSIVVKKQTELVRGFHPLA